MRRGFPIFLATLGVLCLLVGVPALWVQQNIVSADGFVALNKSVENDPKFEESLASDAVESTLSRLTIPDLLKPTVEQLASSQVKEMRNSPDYPKAFADTIRSSHAALFPPSPSKEQPQLAIDMAPMINLMVKPLVSSLLKDAGPAAGAISQLGNLDQLQQTGPVYRKLTDKNPTMMVDLTKGYGSAGLPLCIAGGALIVIGFALARRRGTLLIVVGVGGLVVGLLHWLITPFALQVLESFTSSNQLANAYISALEPAIRTSIDSWVRLEAMVAAALLVLGIVVNLIFRKPRR